MNPIQRQGEQFGFFHEAAPGDELNRGENPWFATTRQPHLDHATEHHDPQVEHFSSLLSGPRIHTGYLHEAAPLEWTPTDEHGKSYRSGPYTVQEHGFKDWGLSHDEQGELGRHKRPSEAWFDANSREDQDWKTLI